MGGLIDACETLTALARLVLSGRIVFILALLGLCAAYLQGGLTKALDFDGAKSEMRGFGLAPAGPMAVAVIVLELGASAMILSGVGRWLGALALAGFTLASSLIALRFWKLSVVQGRRVVANAFFEHLGLVGGLLLVAWLDLAGKTTF